jgi:hypothetical protein
MALIRLMPSLEVIQVKNAICLASDACWGHFRLLRPFILVRAIDNIAEVYGGNKELVSTITHRLFKLVDCLGRFLSGEWLYIFQILRNVKSGIQTGTKMESYVKGIFDIARDLI